MLQDWLLDGSLGRTVVVITLARCSGRGQIRLETMIKSLELMGEPMIGHQRDDQSLDRTMACGGSALKQTSRV